MILAPLLIITFAIALTWHRITRPYALATWVLASVLIAYTTPGLFASWFGKPSRGYVGPLIQIAMFGMGATLTVFDFARVLKYPWAVAIGMILQFTVMPFVGWALTIVFQLQADLAVGVILIGCCPGGVASNVITYLARGNVPLSVTMTACSTLAAPIMTPFLLSLLAGKIIDIPLQAMIYEILRIVILPVAAGIVVNHFLTVAKVDSAKAERVLSIVSMVSICLICGIIVADARAALNSIGFWFLIVIAAHNLIGYTLGYWGARWSGLDEQASRTIAIEVGMQNGGMGASLATNVLKNTTIALASAIFGSWMTIAGSFLAAYWRRRIPSELASTSLSYQKKDQSR